jgi:hypothetical protein
VVQKRMGCFRGVVIIQCLISPPDRPRHSLMLLMYFIIHSGVVHYWVMRGWLVRSLLVCTRNWLQMRQSVPRDMNFSTASCATFSLLRPFFFYDWLEIKLISRHSVGASTFVLAVDHHITLMYLFSLI